MQPTTITRTTWIAFSAALAAAMMDLLDATIASTAGPVMQADLGGSYADLQWITAAYTLATAVGLLTGGRLGDLFGRKRMLLIGAGGFTIASLLCAAAPTAELLIDSRALQGDALGAVMLPQVFGLVRDLFPPDQMGKAWAVLGPVPGLSAVLGPIVAGLLIDADRAADFLPPRSRRSSSPSRCWRPRSRSPSCSRGTPGRTRCPRSADGQHRT